MTDFVASQGMKVTQPTSLFSRIAESLQADRSRHLEPLRAKVRYHIGAFPSGKETFQNDNVMPCELLRSYRAWMLNWPTPLPAISWLSSILYQDELVAIGCMNKLV